MNTWKRKALAVLAVALLGVPAAMGVYKALEPTRGPWAAGLAAGGFELVYISTAILVLTPELRAYARRVALAAVATSVLLNTLADYAHRVPDGLASWTQAQRLFDPLALGLSVVESLPLAGLAYAMAELLHRLAEAETGQSPTPRLPRQRRRWALPAWFRWPQFDRAPAPVYQAETRQEGDLLADLLTEGPPTRSEPSRTHVCRRCGAGPFDFAALGRHARDECSARAEPLTQPAAD